MAAQPQQPTLSEARVNGYEVSKRQGLQAPARTPQPVLATIHTALGRAMATPSLREQLLSLGIEPVFGTPEAFAALIRSETVKWAEIVRKSGATAE
jgi:tripartite-type tricarboxylate transporter receptor subunit TctC